MNLLGGLQEEVTAQLAAHPFFTDEATAPELRRPITVLREQLFDIEHQIALKIGQLGIVAVVLTVSGKNSRLNARKPYFEQILVVVRVCENVVLNRSADGTGQPASHVAEACALILHGWKPEGLGAALLCQSVALGADPKFNIFDAVFTIQAGMTDDSATRLPLPTTP